MKKLNQAGDALPLGSFQDTSMLVRSPQGSW